MKPYRLHAGDLTGQHLYVSRAPIRHKTYTEIGQYIDDELADCSTHHLSPDVVREAGDKWCLIGWINVIVFDFDSEDAQDQ